MKKRIFASLLASVLVILCLAVSVSAEKVAGTVYNGLKAAPMEGGSTAAGNTCTTDANGNIAFDLGSSDSPFQGGWFTDAAGTEIVVKDFIWEFDYTTTNSWSNFRLFFRANSGWGNGDYCMWINGSDNMWGCAGNQEGYTDCRISITENEKQGANAVAIKPYVIAPNTVHHFKLQVIGKDVTLWVTPEGGTAGEPLMTATIDALADEGKLQFQAYSAGVFTLANSKVTTLVDKVEEAPETADNFVAPVVAVAILSFGVIALTKKH